MTNAIRNAFSMITQRLNCFSPPRNSTSECHAGSKINNHGQASMASTSDHERLHQIVPHSTFARHFNIQLQTLNAYCEYIKTHLGPSAPTTNEQHNSVQDSLAQLSRFLTDEHRSPYTQEERASDEFRALLHNISPQNHQHPSNGLFLNHVDQMFSNMADLTKLQDTLSDYVSTLIKMTPSNPEAVKRALVIFPPNAEDLHCAPGTLNRLITAKLLLIQQPHQLLMSFFHKLVEDTAKSIRGRFNQGNEIHIPATCFYLVTGEDETASRMDHFFKIPKPFFSAKNMWNQFVDLTKMATEIKSEIQNVGAGIKDFEQITIAEQNTLFKPWGLNPWNEEAESIYKNATDFSEALLSQLNNQLFDCPTITLDAIGTSNLKLPSFAEVNSSEGKAWMRAQLQSDQCSYPLLQRAALQGLFLLSEEIRFRNPALAYEVVQSLGPGTSIHTGLEHLQQLTICSQQQPMFLSLQKNLENFDIDSQTSSAFIDPRASFITKLKLQQAISGASIAPEEIRGLVKHLKLKIRSDCRELLLHTLAKNNGHALLDILKPSTSLLNNREPKLGYTPLIIAAESAHQEAVQCLIRKNADLDASNYNGDTALHRACAMGHDKIVTLFINAKADLNKSNVRALTPLAVAAFHNHDNILRLLIEAKADINKATHYGSMPLYVASKQGHDRIVQLLIEAGADVNAPIDCNLAPLSIAAESGHHRIVQLLIEAGADVNVLSDRYLTPLYLASRYGHDRIVQQLIQAGADVNTSSIIGMTPLYTAIQSGHDRIVQLLIEAGADVNSPGLNNFTPLCNASSHGQEGIVQQLIQAGADVNTSTRNRVSALHLAARSGHGRIVQQLIQAKANVDKQNIDGATPLFLACTQGHTSIAQQLIEAGANTDLPAHPGQAPLHIAAYYGFIEIIKLLINAKVDVNAHTRSGETPLSIAIGTINFQAFKLLLAAGARIDDKFDGQPLIKLAANTFPPTFLESLNLHVHPDTSVPQ